MIRICISFSVLALMACTSYAEFHCGNASCNAVINSTWWKGPCPACGQNTVHAHPHPTPTPPVPSPSPFPVPPPSPGGSLMLGITVSQRGGVVVDSVSPGSVAAGKLFQNDRFVRYAYNDSFSGQIHRGYVNQVSDLTTMKNSAGAGNPIAILVTRPVYGARKFLLTLSSPGAPQTQSYTVQVPYTTSGGVTQMRSEMRTRSMKSSGGATITEGGAQADMLLGGGSGQVPVPTPGPTPAPTPSPSPVPGGGSLLDNL